MVRILFTKNYKIEAEAMQTRDVFIFTQINAMLMYKEKKSNFMESNIQHSSTRAVLQKTHPAPVVDAPEPESSRNCLS